MRAAAIVENNGRRQLEVVDNLPEPAPGEGELLVRVGAGGLNRADLVMPLRHRHGTGRVGPGGRRERVRGHGGSPRSGREPIFGRGPGDGVRRFDLRRADDGQSPARLSGSRRYGVGNGDHLPRGGRDHARCDRHQRPSRRGREHPVPRRRIRCRYPRHADCERPRGHPWSLEPRGPRSAFRALPGSAWTTASTWAIPTGPTASGR